MSDAEHIDAIVGYWFGKSDQALASAESELGAARYSFAVNRAYYACFYSASAVLLARGARFTKHAGVRAAIHRDLVKPGLLASEAGTAYDRLFDRRQEADYAELVVFTLEDVERFLVAARYVVGALRPLATR